MKRAFVLVLLTACGAAKESNPSASCAVSGRTRSAIVTRFGFVRPDPAQPEVAAGFDLDGRKSDDRDARGCRQPDFTAPDGVLGVDNQLARLLPLIDSMSGGALDGAVSSAINNGQLLVAITVDGLDDRCNDDSVTLRLQRVSGTPLVGADQRIDPGQTFELDPEGGESAIAARVKNGFVEAGPSSLELPVSILDAQFPASFHGARVRLRLSDDGAIDGVLGGGLDREELMTHVRGFTLEADFVTALDAALELFADLDPDASGACRQFSAAIELEARPAFVLR
ncbi:MAG: hypothetical protein IT381_00305 [Deltaproteobacteria bacterium]|nr:hypothetical protein [Deltaproteobacteria bacterium]